MATFPNVPNVPGVPRLLRNPLGVAISIALLVADGISLFAGIMNPWGLYLDGVKVVDAESVVGIDFKKTSFVATYPLESGAFESYDKVQQPFDVRVRFASGGSITERQALIDSVAAIADDLELYDVVTPEVIYTSVNVVHHDYRRTSDKGVGLVTLDVWLVQVRVTASASFSNTKSPSAAGNVNGGTVQTSSFDEAGFSAGSVT